MSWWGRETKGCLLEMRKNLLLGFCVFSTARSPVPTGRRLSGCHGVTDHLPSQVAAFPWNLLWNLISETDLSTPHCITVPLNSSSLAQMACNCSSKQPTPPTHVHSTVFVPLLMHAGSFPLGFSQLLWFPLGPCHVSAWVLRVFNRQIACTNRLKIA